MSSTGIQRCWICGGEAGSREHLIKASDLRAVFGEPSQEQPIFFSSGKMKNKRVGSLKADILKSTAAMCARCNNERTQPHDFSWQILSEAFRDFYSPITPGVVVRADRVFPLEATKHMLNVHLFFVKQFGCRASAESIPLDLSTFAQAIIQNKAHPNLFLRFGQTAWAKQGNISGMSEVTGNELDGECKTASFFYHIKDLAISITYIENRERWHVYPNAWHPTYCRNRFVLTNFLDRAGLPVTP